MLEHHSAFDGINHVFAGTRNGTKHAEHDGIETSRCYCDILRERRERNCGKKNCIVVKNPNASWVDLGNFSPCMD